MKYKKKYGVFFASFRLLNFMTNDFLNHLLITLGTRLASNKNYVKNKRILFLEPIQQGYGDLIFQTPIFESLNKAGYKVTVVIRKDHYPILQGNPFISHIYYWEEARNISTLQSQKFNCVIFLGRDTLRETLFGLSFKDARKIILDKDLNRWRLAFSTNHTIAWQKIVNGFFGNTLEFSEPKIYTSTPAHVKNGLNRCIAIIAGVDKQEKAYPKILELVDLLARQETGLKIYLLGRNSPESSRKLKNFDQKNVFDLVNKQTYYEVISFISKMNLVIGTEGSLVHVSSTLGIPTVVIEVLGHFWEHSGLNRAKPIQTLPGHSSPLEILRASTELLKLPR